MSKRKIIFSIIFFVMIFGITIYIIFSQNSITDIINSVKSVNILYIIIGILLMVGYFLMQGIYMKITLKTLDIKITTLKGMFYSIVEFFFSGITPSSTGGQPVQLYYMSKDKIPTEKSLIVLIINAIVFKLFLVVFGFIIMICNSSLVYEHGIYAKILFSLGMVVDVIVTIVCYLLMYNRVVIQKIVKMYYGFLNRITHKDTNYEEKIEDILKKYSNNAEFIKNHKKDVAIGVAIIFVQRILMFSITYVVYRGLGFNEISYWNLLLLQIFAQITIEGLPLPGGTGALEAILNNIYISIFGGLTIISTVLTRMLTFYLPLVITMIIIIVVTRRKYLSTRKI